MAEQLLSNRKEERVCVFEKEDRLGGRIYDYQFKDLAPNVSVGKQHTNSSLHVSSLSAISGGC